MPTVFRKDGFRFWFYSNENSEPAHIHVGKGDAEGKIWLVPRTEIAYMRGFTAAEMKQIAVIAFEYATHFKSEWDGYFGK